MILSCEQCQARYLVASLLLGVGGRTVKCGVCGHSWFQPPVDEVYEAPKSFGEHLDHEILDSIPEGVRPIPEGSSVPTVKKEKFRFNFKEHLSKENMTGGAATAAVFVVLFSVMALFHAPIVRAWAPADLLFSSIGLSTPIPGEGLIFNQVTAHAKADADGQYVLTVSGNIINLHNEDIAVPGVYAALEKSGDDMGANFMIPVDKTTIGPEGKISFTATYENPPKDATDLKITFAGH